MNLQIERRKYVIDTLDVQVDKDIEYISYEECGTIVKANGIKSIAEYQKFVKANPNLNMPLHPDKVY